MGGVFFAGQLDSACGSLGSLPQSLGLSNSHDRALVKRKLKELAAAAEKERKAQEKAARQREKLRRREQEAKKS